MSTTGRDAAKAAVKKILLVEKARAGLSYTQLSQRLAQVGIRQSATNLSTKISRGGIGADYFLALLLVMGRDAVSLEELHLPLNPGANKPRSRKTPKKR